MPASRKEKDSTNHLEHRSINHPAGPKYLKDLALRQRPGDRAAFPANLIKHDISQLTALVKTWLRRMQ
jgi:hypothetical protein